MSPVSYFWHQSLTFSCLLPLSLHTKTLLWLSFPDMLLLAAPQIGVPLRVFTWDVDDEVGHLVNPILDLSDELQDGEEGCLSFPELRYNTPRAFRAVAKGFNMYGDPVIIEGTEFLARALQHETDHLDGILFIDRLNDENRKAAMKEIRESDWFGIASASGNQPIIKVSPHNNFGKGH